MARLLQPIDIAKLFLVVREQMLDADNPHPLRKYITVEDMEKYNGYLETYAENKRKEQKYKKEFLNSKK